MRLTVKPRPEWTQFPAVDLDALQRLEDSIPHIHALGIELIEVDGPVAISRLPYAEHLVGDPATGILHGGAITTQIDNLSAVAMHSGIGHAVPCATIDLRVEYLKPATPKRDVFARSELRRITRQVAFITSRAYHDPDDPIALATCTYMLLPERQSTLKEETPSHE
ncbi:MAG: PaaI family thioesterase [Minwuia sp.]|uniref:PaaI family thioesterase n=1 Tax=Minwuia sp. TaxID=2493630 RepID=UPI003A8A5A53